MKAITSIISIIILLLIAISLAGAAYTFVSGYFSTITGKVLAVKDAFCSSSGVANIILQNVGTEPITTSSGMLLQTEEYTPDPDTLALWHFNGNLNDAGKYNFLGTYKTNTTGATVNFTDGKLGSGALFLNLSRGERVEIPDPTDILTVGNDVGEAFTIEAWMFPIPGHEEENIIVRGPYGTGETGSGGWRLRDQRGSDTLSFTMDGVSDPSTNVGQIDNRWVHIAGVFESTGSTSSVLRLYIDGKETSSTSSSTRGTVLYSTTLTNDPIIGRGGWGDLRDVFHGYIDEVRISDSARNFTQPQQGWNYVCSGSGDTYDCGEISIVKTAGDTAAFLPAFSETEVRPGDSITLKDASCQDEFCEYRIRSPSGTATARILC